MSGNPITENDWTREFAESVLSRGSNIAVTEAEATLQELAHVFLESRFLATQSAGESAAGESASGERADEFASGPDSSNQPHSVEARYRALVEQIPAVVFMAYLDEGIGEAYVSPQIEAALGFTQAEWLEDPVRWYDQIYPDDKQRWSTEAAEMFLSGKPLKSAYRVLARDGRVLWFHCEAEMIRRRDGRPWFIHGVGVDITELKQAEEALQDERNVLSAILDIVGALIVVLDPQGRIVRFNRTCEETTGYTFAEVQGKFVWDLFLLPEEVENFKSMFEDTGAAQAPGTQETYLLTRDGTSRRITWSSTILAGKNAATSHVIATGIDITERQRLEKALLEVSAREQRRIGEDLHDGLGQHLTGIAFMSKVLESKLCEKALPESDEAAKIVKLVNEAINKTRELSRGLLPVVSDAHGLMSALTRYAEEMQDLFRISCRFECGAAVLVYDVNMATHLYHIAREAVNNAIKHGKPGHVVIGLSVENGEGTLSVQDDGEGISGIPANHAGMGLNIMSYRANMIGGSLEVARNFTGGTTVVCLFPLGARA
ncbi:MAG TPA: PAS domain S-box protein [Candidatus Acidoferrales bacterium]|nr:PAS domain S-box protein [Candidatus Acidoferrales bacterium]